MELPQGMFGISLATYLLPTLSSLAAEKNYSEFRVTLRQGLGSLIFLNLIASVLLVVLAEPIVRLLFERGTFNADATDARDAGAPCASRRDWWRFRRSTFWRGRFSRWATPRRR